MFEGYVYNCEQKRQALRNALNVFGESAYRLLVFQLEERYKLVINGSPCSAVTDIESALRDIAGPSADLVIARMHEFLRESLLQEQLHLGGVPNRKKF